MSFPKKVDFLFLKDCFISKILVVILFSLTFGAVFLIGREDETQKQLKKKRVTVFKILQSSLFL
jgi:hypothetical protein